jgi:hypothetical protein
VRLKDGSEIEARQVVLATGHSASDVYALLVEQGVRLVSGDGHKKRKKLYDRRRILTSRCIWHESIGLCNK